MSRSNLTSRAKKERPLHYKKVGDQEMLVTVKEIVNNRPTYGYRRVAALLNGKLKEQNKSKINRKKVYRLMKQNQLLLRKAPVRAKRAHDGKVTTLLSNTRWCSDSFRIQCFNGDQVNVAFALDTCDREVMGYIASTRGINSQMIQDLMLETVEYRFGASKTPHVVQWLSDNGGCYTARETVNFGRQLGLDIRTTPAYSPESNGMAEAFVKTLKRDYVWFGNLKDAQTVLGQLSKWFEDYNEKAPHKGLNMLSPREFLKETKRAS